MNMSSPGNNRSVVKTVLAVEVVAIAALVVLVQRQSPIRENPPFHHNRRVVMKR